MLSQTFEGFALAQLPVSLSAYTRYVLVSRQRKFPRGLVTSYLFTGFARNEMQIKEVRSRRLLFLNREMKRVYRNPVTLIQFLFSRLYDMIMERLVANFSAHLLF